MLSPSALLLVLILYMVMSYLLIGWKYKNHATLNSPLQDILDKLHIVVVFSNILFFWMFAFFEYHNKWDSVGSFGAMLTLFGIGVILLSMRVLGKATFSQG